MLKKKLLAVLEKNEDREFHLPADLKSRTVDPRWFNRILDAFIDNRIDSYRLLPLIQGMLPPETSLFELLDLVKRNEHFPFKFLWEKGNLMPTQITTVPSSPEADYSLSVTASSSSSVDSSMAGLSSHSIFSHEKEWNENRAERESEALRQAKCFTALPPMPMPTR